MKGNKMSKTPADYIHEGREAFDENTLPENVCLYRGNSDSPMFKKYYWFRGWEEAEKEFLKEQKSKKKCEIINSRFAYILKVDEVQISLTDGVEYFKKHYRDLGYTVIEINKEDY